MEKTIEKNSEQSRRSFVQTAAWVAPAILTLSVTPAYAQLGSTRQGGEGGNQQAGRGGQQGRGRGQQGGGRGQQSGGRGQQRRGRGQQGRGGG